MNNQDLLRPMFSYSILIIVIVLILIGILFFLLRKKKPVKEVPPVIKRPAPRNLFVIKNNYLMQINELRDQLKNNTIETRKAYQKLSVIIRNFIFETTQIRVQYYSLQEITQANIPVLTELVEEYYAPEFSKEGEGDCLSSLEKTREVIEKWQ